VERIEQLDTELQELNEQKKEVFAEAKGEGFDVKVLKEIIKLASRTRTSATSTKPARRLHARHGISRATTRRRSGVEPSI
jgi:hypothetical protein